jgi:hypothetical protein
MSVNPDEHRATSQGQHVQGSRALEVRCSHPSFYCVSTRNRTGLSSHYGTPGPNDNPLIFFIELRTDEHRLRQAKAMLLMRRTCNLYVSDN